MLRVVLVDDHRILQQGLTRLIESEKDAKVVAYAGSAQEGLEVVTRVITCAQFYQARGTRASGPTKSAAYLDLAFFTWRRRNLAS